MTASPTAVLDRDQIVAYATLFDPQPQHLDEARAAATPFGELVASGWQTAAITLRLAEQSPDWPGGRFRIDSLLWQRPVRPGDALRVTLTREGAGFRLDTLDQDGRTVQTITGATEE